ncbi:hypothetical protein [Intestinibacter sp.]
MEFYKRKSQLKNTLKETGLFAAFDVLKDNSKVLELGLKPGVRMFAGDFFEISISIPNFSPYNSINYVICKLDDSKKRSSVLKLLHKFNNDSLVIKYYITAENFIIAKITYIGYGNSFDSYEFVELLQDGLGIVSDVKYDIMNIL